MECPWNDAFHMDSMDQSMWIPYGFHGMPNEIKSRFHGLFHMDSMEYFT
jgi:hypothetical protein